MDAPHWLWLNEFDRGWDGVVWDVERVDDNGVYLTLWGDRHGPYPRRSTAQAPNALNSATPPAGNGSADTVSERPSPPL